MSLNLKRPKRIGEEDEDDLIRFQEEFLKSRSEQPAAKVIRKQPEKQEQLKEVQISEKKQQSIKKKDKIEFDFESDNKALASVLSDIIEKPIKREWSELIEIKKAVDVPKIEKLNLNELNQELSVGKRKNKSLFAQNLEKQGKLKSYFALEQVHQPDLLREDEKLRQIEQKINFSKTTQNESVLKSIQQKARKQMITGEGLGNVKDVEQIHFENLEILSKMKPEEILTEQQKLISQLDPKIIAFIKGKNLKNQENIGFESKLESNQTNRLTEEEIIEQLPIKPNKKWLHMDKIEYDKLEWMLKPKNVFKNTKTSSSARFDFEGNLISPEEDVPVTKALHHHGNESDQAGYTLDELFHLARSKFNQQRVLAIQTLGNILKKCHLGDYHQIVRSGEDHNQNEDNEETQENDKNNLLNQLIDGGILFLLRWSLDDQTESIINASLISIKNLLQPVYQEQDLDYCFDLYKGFEMPCLHPFSSIFLEKKTQLSVDKNLNLNEEKDLDELKDNEFIKQDLIRGLFRMNLMERIFYLLNRYQPTLTSNQIQQSIFMILFRCMRHSPELCFDFTEKYSNLIELIISQFLPTYIDTNQTDLSNFLKNCANSIKLLRLISCAGPTIAYKLYKKYNLKTKINNYLTIEKYINDQTLSDEILILQIETIRLLKTLIVYSENEMGIDCLIDFYEILLKHLNSIILSLNQNENELKSMFLRSLISLFDCLILGLKENDSISEFKSEISNNVYTLLSKFVITKFKSIFDEKIQEVSQEKIDLNLISCCLNYLVDFLERIEYSTYGNKAELLNKKLLYIELLIDDLIEPIITSGNKLNQLKLDQLIMSKLLPFSTSYNSNLVYDRFKKILTNNLSYLPTILSIPKDDKIDFIQKNPYCFLASYLRLFNLCMKSKMKMIDDKKFKNTKYFLNNSYLKSYFKSYMKNMNQSKESCNNSFYLMKFENFFVYQCLKLAFFIFNFEDEETCQDNFEELNEKRFYYLIALSLVLKLKSGDEYYLSDMLGSILFNMNFWSNYLSSKKEKNSISFLIKYFEKLHLNNEDNQIEFSYLNINFGQSETIRININFISKMESIHIYETLNQIKFTYLNLIDDRLLEHSKLLNFIFPPENMQQQRPKLKNLFLNNLNSNKFLVKPDWIYLPIISQVAEMQNLKKKQNLNEQEKEISISKITSIISNSLKFIYLIENYFETDYLETILNHTQRYIKLLYVYLFDPEVFLDKQIITLMYLFLFKYSKDRKEPLKNLNFAIKLDEIISFYDFYQYLLTQYDSTSFGDYLFSQYLIVPLQQCYPVKYRQLFWSDFHHLFKYMRFDSQQSKLLIPLKNFIEPNEKNLHMIRLYSQILLDPNDFNLVKNSKLAYTILIASLNSFIFEHINKLEHNVEFDFKKLLLNKFLSLSEKLKNHLLNYKSLNPTTEEIETFEELPLIRKQWVNTLTS